MTPIDAAHRLRVFRRVLIHDPDLAAVRAQVGGQQVHGGRLAGAVRPEQGEHRALRHRQVDAVEDGLVAEGLPQASDTDGGRARRGRRRLGGYPGTHAQASTRGTRRMTTSPSLVFARTSTVSHGLGRVGFARGLELVVDLADGGAQLEPGGAALADTDVDAPVLAGGRRLAAHDLADPDLAVGVGGGDVGERAVDGHRAVGRLDLRLAGDGAERDGPVAVGDVRRCRR